VLLGADGIAHHHHYADGVVDDFFECVLPYPAGVAAVGEDAQQRGALPLERECDLCR
jgi:hypothetical protein